MNDLLHPFTFMATLNGQANQTQKISNIISKKVCVMRNLFSQPNSRQLIKGLWPVNDNTLPIFHLIHNHIQLTVAVVENIAAYFQRFLWFSYLISVKVLVL